MNRAITGTASSDLLQPCRRSPISLIRPNIVRQSKVFQLTLPQFLIGLPLGDIFTIGREGGAGRTGSLVGVRIPGGIKADERQTESKDCPCTHQTIKGDGLSGAEMIDAPPFPHGGQPHGHHTLPGNLLRGLALQQTGPAQSTERGRENIIRAVFLRKMIDTRGVFCVYFPYGSDGAMQLVLVAQDFGLVRRVHRQLVYLRGPSREGPRFF
jgi:hypothetical protein